MKCRKATVRVLRVGGSGYFFAFHILNIGIIGGGGGGGGGWLLVKIPWDSPYVTVQ